MTRQTGHSVLTHVDESGAARMVDVTDKPPTTRTAVATGRVDTTTEVIRLLCGGDLPKGDALTTARIAGILGAKRTSDLVPLCHPLALTSVTVDLEPAGSQVFIRATVRTAGPTGVEMEALTAFAIAGLTVHDMIKAVDPAAVLDKVRLESKDGGKSGSWVRPNSQSTPSHETVNSGPGSQAGDATQSTRTRTFGGGSFA